MILRSGRFRSLIGNKQFYKTLFIIAFPIMIQNGITHFVALLDNIMIGSVGTSEMSGVSIINQLIFVFNLCIFGAISGAGIFGAQFFGQGNHEGLRYTFRFKMIVSLIISALGIGIFIFFGKELAMFYMNEQGDSILSVDETLAYSMDYLKIMLIGLVPFAIEQCYAGTLRETNETALPMKAGAVAVCINLILNYILIFGHFGAPMLGVKGAAIATVTARIIECLIVVLWTHIKSSRNLFIIGAYRGFGIPWSLTKQMIIKGTPLLINEGLWSAGMAMLTQSYSMRGLSVVGAFSISTTIGNLFNVMFVAIGSAVAIIVGQHLGAGKFNEAMDSAKKIVFATFVLNVIISILLYFLAPLFPEIYKTTDEVRMLATMFIQIAAVFMPIQAMLHAAYFVIRSGGRTIITFLFDSAFMWTVQIPLAFVLTRYTELPIIPIFIICQIPDVIKTGIGLVMMIKGIWLSNIVSNVIND